MIILSDCLTEKVDEGCLKVANSLIKKIKEMYPETMVISYKRKSQQSDVHLKLNKLFLNPRLFSLLKSRNEETMYIPFASNTRASAIRIWVLSRVVKKGIRVIFILRHPMDTFTKFLLKMSGAEIIALSKESYEFYLREVGDKVLYLKTGIDTEKFIPVSVKEKNRIRKIYNVAPGKKVLLHVGHLKKGRNVDKLLNVGTDYHVFLVVSSVTEEEKDGKLREKLENRKNTTIIESYIEHIEEVYQMSDVYLFPVQQDGNCIDVPLSVLEAASCNIPIVATDYGELKAFQNERGFRFISSFDVNTLNQAIDEMTGGQTYDNRNAIQEYDWDVSIKHLIKQNG